MEQLLLNALDYGIKEVEFWEMTPREVGRATKSREKLMKVEARERATFDYIQAQLVIKGISICLGDKSSFPTLQEAYVGIFDEMVEEQEAKVQERKHELSALRFKLFAQSYNNQFRNKEVPK